jgi:hypothetical protein
MIRVGPAGWSYEDWKGNVYPEPRPRRFDELGHGPALPRRLALELSHDRVVDVQRRLHMDYHTIDMGICQRRFGNVPPLLPSIA